MSIRETILLGESKWLLLNRIVSLKWHYLGSVIYVQVELVGWLGFMAYQPL